jgi:hypothetical protein
MLLIAPMRVQLSAGSRIGEAHDLPRWLAAKQGINERATEDVAGTSRVQGLHADSGFMNDFMAGKQERATRPKRDAEHGVVRSAQPLQGTRQISLPRQFRRNVFREDWNRDRLDECLDIICRPLDVARHRLSCGHGHIR